MDEIVGATSAVVVAIITVVVTIISVIKDRSGLHHLEKLGGVINSMKATSVQRKVLESIRDEAATEWGVRTLARRERKKLRWTLYGLGLLYFAVLAWSTSYTFLWWLEIPAPPEWLAIWGVLGSYAAWMTVLIIRANRLSVWERKQRELWKLPAKPHG